MWRALAVAVLVAASGSCGWVEDRFQTCRDLRIDLVNERQSLSVVYLAGEDESFGEQTRLEPGASRRLVRCLDRGDRERFRALRENEIVGTVVCVVERHPDEFQAAVSRVVWSADGFHCENW